MKISEQKTKYLVAVGNRTILDVGKIVAFGNKNFEFVNKFVYLETVVTRVWRYSEESKLQPAKTSAVISPGLSDKVTAVGADKKGREP
jgi:hypothetical protein